MAKKLFISQPMGGLTKEEIMEQRNIAIIEAKNVVGDDVEVMETYFEDYNPSGGCRPLKHLAKSLELLADADVVYFAKGWEERRGCVIEHECCVQYGHAMIKDNICIMNK